jgi:hypothetical protein
MFLKNVPTSVPIPKFALACGLLGCERRNQRGSSKPMICASLLGLRSSSSLLFRAEHLRGTRAKTQILCCQPCSARSLRCFSQRTAHVPKRDRRRIVNLNPTASFGAFETKRNEARAVNARASTALAPIGRAQEHTSSHRHVSTRPNASFVTHLIATAEQAPQTRALRRATPADALGAYGGATARTATTASNCENMSRVA